MHVHHALLKLYTQIKHSMGIKHMVIGINERMIFNEI